MPDYLFYWKPETVNDTAEGVPLLYSASDQFGRVGPGDVVWIVTSRPRGEMTLVGRLPVAQVTASRSEAQSWVGRDDLWEAQWYALADEAAAGPKQELDVSSIALRLRFDGTPDRLPEGFTGQHLQSMRRLTSESAQLLETAGAFSADGVRRNPAWQRDELILALDLYIRLDRRLPTTTTPR